MIVVHVNVRAGSRRQFRGGLFAVDLSVDVDVGITVLLSIITIVSIVLLIDTNIVAALEISLQIRVYIVLTMILILVVVMVLLIPTHSSLLLGPIRFDIDRDALFPQRIHRVRQRLVRIDLFRVIVIVVLFGVIGVGVHRCIFFVFVLVYVGVGVVVMVIRRFVEMLQCL